MRTLYVISVHNKISIKKHCFVTGAVSLHAPVHIPFIVSVILIMVVRGNMVKSYLGFFEICDDTMM